MNIKLLFLIVISLLFSSCYTRYVYIYTDEPVDEVYIYDVNYVYTNLWYDDFYWRYDNGGCYFGFNYYGYNYYHSPYYYHSYPYYYNYRPYYKHHRRARLSSRHTARRLLNYNKSNNQIGRGKARIKNTRQIQRKYQMNDKKRMIIPRSKYRDQVIPKNQHKFNNRTKKRDQVVTKQKSNNRSKNKTKFRQNKRNNRSKNKTKFRQNKRNNSSKRSTIKRQNNSPRKSTKSTKQNKVKRSTKKGRR